MRKKFYRQIEIDASGGFFKQNINNYENLTKSHTYDAGLDIRSEEEFTFLPGERKLVSTGVHLEILPGYVGLIWARSGLSVNHGIMIGAGCIDATYRGEVKILMFNMGDEEYTVRKGDKIAQLLTIPINIGMYLEVPYLSPTERGDDGFGSTGK